MVYKSAFSGSSGGLTISTDNSSKLHIDTMRFTDSPQTPWGDYTYHGSFSIVGSTASGSRDIFTWNGSNGSYSWSDLTYDISDCTSVSFSVVGTVGSGYITGTLSVSGISAY